MIREAFAHGPKGAALGVPMKALSTLWASRVAQSIQRLGGEVRLQEPALGFDVKNTKINGVLVRKREILRAGAVVSAVPPDVLARLLGRELNGQTPFSNLGKLCPGPIASAYCWLEEPDEGPRFEAILDEDWDWLFRPDVVAERGVESGVSVGRSRGFHRIQGSVDHGNLLQEIA